MSRRRSARKQAMRRARQQRAPVWVKAIPYLALGGLAAIIVGGLFALNLGTGSGSAHPDGYEPPVLGDPDAPVEFVMFEDFQCPFCKRFETETFPELRSRAEAGEVKFVWRNFQRYGSESTNSAIAAHCAGEQEPEKFWDLKDVIFENQNGIQTGALSNDNLRQWAAEIGVDVNEYDSCFESRGQFYRDAMDADRAMAIDMGVNGTPGFSINGQLVSGAQSTSTFEAYIDGALADLQQ